MREFQHFKSKPLVSLLSGRGCTVVNLESNVIPPIAKGIVITLRVIGHGQIDQLIAFSVRIYKTASTSCSSAYICSAPELIQSDANLRPKRRNQASQEYKRKSLLCNRWCCLLYSRGYVDKLELRWKNKDPLNGCGALLTKIPRVPCIITWATQAPSLIKCWSQISALKKEDPDGYRVEKKFVRISK